MNYQRTLQKIQSETSGFIGASIVDLDSGMALASVASRPDFDLEAASAYNSEMVKGKLKTMQVLNLQTDLEDMLLTLGDQLHLIKMLPDNSFLYLAASRADTNLALLRRTVNHVVADA